MNAAALTRWMLLPKTLRSSCEVTRYDGKGAHFMYLSLPAPAIVGHRIMSPSSAGVKKYPLSWRPSLFRRRTQLLVQAGDGSHGEHRGRCAGFWDASQTKVSERGPACLFTMRM